MTQKSHGVVSDFDKRTEMSDSDHTKIKRFCYNAKVVRVVDGDTLDLMVDLGFSIHHKIRVRLNGVNTPESRTRDLAEKALGLKANDYVVDWLDGHPEIVLETSKDKAGKFGRILATIWSDGEMTACLNKDLIDSGNAVEYFGGKR